MEKINDGLTPQQRYHKKVGWKPKSFMLKEEDVKAFSEACKKAGVSMASQITKMMREFVQSQE